MEKGVENRPRASANELVSGGQGVWAMFMGTARQRHDQGTPYNKRISSNQTNRDMGNVYCVTSVKKAKKEHVLLL